MTTEFDPVLFAELAWISKKGQYFQLAAATVVIWDHVTTFDSEVELIWRQRKSLIQFLYFLVRYSGDALFLHTVAVLLLIPEENFLEPCPSYTRVQVVLGGIVLNSMQAIMVHRVVSMYRHQENVYRNLRIALGALICVSIVVAFFSLNLQRAVAYSFVYAPTLRVCAAWDIPRWSVITWFMAMVFDFSIWILSAKEGLRYLRESQELTLQSSSRYLTAKNWSKQGILFRVLLRDSIAFPFISVIVALSNILSWLVPQLIFAGTYTTAISSVTITLLGCRLILNLRDAYYHPFAEEFHRSLRVLDDPEVMEMADLPSSSNSHRPSVESDVVPTPPPAIALPATTLTPRRTYEPPHSP
ncbi:hypothetical protein FA13DRAFT_1733220 [Coprinellus micaceus]|uniref:DUF6533 domain-containing protein n=1 Tax=Coprinellus micaceus TaxID=71717 RepID=A0A4Y7TB37_COPMI|nr:hypothetical protein FA13DRAFT_1733220 [Coprinellus micaceus]